jgi:RNA polymerase sigma-70 factor (ECF subfamily)
MSLQFTDEVNGQNVYNLPTGNSAESIEIALVAAAKSGDAAAFEELVCRHRRRLRRLAQRITHNREDAEDAVQGSLLRAFSHLAGFRGDSEFSTWLTRIVINEALMNLRKSFRRNEVPLNESGGNEDVYLHSEVADFGLSPEESYSWRELQQILSHMIHGLKPNSRIVFQLRYLNQLSTKATASVLRLPVSTVKTRLRRTRLELQHRLQKHVQTGTEERFSTVNEKEAVTRPIEEEV